MRIIIAPVSDTQKLFHDIGDRAFNMGDTNFRWRPYQYNEYMHQHTTLQRWFHQYGDRLIALPILIEKL